MTFQCPAIYPTQGQHIIRLFFFNVAYYSLVVCVSMNNIRKRVYIYFLDHWHGTAAAGWTRKSLVVVFYFVDNFFFIFGRLNSNIDIVEKGARVVLDIKNFFFLRMTKRQILWQFALFPKNNIFRHLLFIFFTSCAFLFLASLSTAKMLFSLGDDCDMLL